VASLHHRSAELHEALGNKDQALAAYDKAWSLDPSRPAWLLDLALSCQQKGDLARAEKHLRALLLAPLDPAAGVARADVHCALAETLLRQGDRARAHEAVRLALADDPRHAQALKLQQKTTGSPK
jgi:tetratricopeptide (TPR) repeat protein